MTYRSLGLKVFDLNPFRGQTSSNLMKMVESFPNGQKTLWEKEKLLSFSLSVFKRPVQQTSRNKGSFGKGLTLPNRILDWSKWKIFAYVKIYVTEKLKFVLGSVENVGKKENARNQHFLLFPNCIKASFSRLVKVRVLW